MLEAGQRSYLKLDTVVQRPGSLNERWQCWKDPCFDAEIL